jgi:hypothetical protein
MLNFKCFIIYRKKRQILILCGRHIVVLRFVQICGQHSLHVLPRLQTPKCSVASIAFTVEVTTTGRFLVVLTGNRNQQTFLMIGMTFITVYTECVNKNT